MDHGSLDWGRRLAALWFGILAGPLAWALLLETNYAMSYVACEQRHAWMLHTATAGAVVLIALGALSAWRAGPPPGPLEQPSIDAETIGVVRARFMAVGGLSLCAFFLLVVLAMEIPALVLNPCSQ